MHALEKWIVIQYNISTKNIINLLSPTCELLGKTDKTVDVVCPIKLLQSTMVTSAV
jgi:hypothetical protein